MEVSCSWQGMSLKWAKNVVACHAFNYTYMVIDTRQYGQDVSETNNLYIMQHMK